MADNTTGRGYPEPRFDSFVSQSHVETPVY